MDFLFVALVAVIYAVTHALVWAFMRLGERE